MQKILAAFLTFVLIVGCISTVSADSRALQEINGEVYIRTNEDLVIANVDYKAVDPTVFNRLFVWALNGPDEGSGKNLPPKDIKITFKNCTFDGVPVYVSTQCLKGNLTLEVKNCTFRNIPNMTAFTSTAQTLIFNNNTIVNCRDGLNTATARDPGWDWPSYEGVTYGITSFTANNNTFKNITRFAIQLSNDMTQLEELSITGNKVNNSSFIVGSSFIKIHNTLRIPKNVFGGIRENSFNNVDDVFYVDYSNGKPKYIVRKPNGSTSESTITYDSLMPLNNPTIVTANADPTYVVVIPANVDFGTLDKRMPRQEKEFTISVENALIEERSAILVENITKDMNMYNENGYGSKKLPFGLEEEFFAFYQEKLEDSEETYTTKIFCDPAKLVAAGDYKGYLTFSVTYALEYLG
ncbi:MAG TPA: hypothetical protein GXX17_08150 [Clostridiales bacterium]|nr:hypothetical protein [Clostridiales bacterium]